MTGQCVGKCNGYSFLRDECARDPCLADGMCKLIDASISNCAEWCCVSRGQYVFFAVFFFSAGTCALLCMYYLSRLHKANVAAGVVTETGERIDVAHAQCGNSSTAVPQQRKKRQVIVDSELLRSIGITTAPTG